MGERFLFMPAPTRGMLPIEYWLEPKYGAAHGRAAEPTWYSYLEKHPEDRERYNRIQNKIRVREAGGKFRKAVSKSKGRRTQRKAFYYKHGNRFYDSGQSGDH